MNCPFCAAKLMSHQALNDTAYWCTASGCAVSDMARFIAIYNNYPTTISRQEFMLGKYYVRINYDDLHTIVYKLDYCLLYDAVKIDRVLKTDFKNLDLMEDKLDTLMLFS